MEKKTIVVTGIGGNVGQGIIRNILATKYPVRIVGLNINNLSAGNHLCDSFYKVPFGYDENYIPVIRKIVEKEKVDLIIPSTDFEIYYLSKNQDIIPCKIACSGAESTDTYLDKYKTWEKHNEWNIPFAKSSLPSLYKGEYAECIAKPRKGRGSRGLIFNPTDISKLNDDEYMIQEVHKGIEITTTVYRKYSDNIILGLISMERTLENGATTFCRIIKDYDSKFLKIAEQMISKTDLSGSFNIQSIVDENGEVHPFEINCRISGTNSLRSGFGFKDVQYTIEELLWGIKPQKPVVSDGVAYRYLADVIYTDAQNIKGNNLDNFILF